MPNIREVTKAKIHDAIWDAFAEGYYKAYEYYEQDRLRECIKACTDLLDEEASIPRFICISTLILLALVVKEEDDFCAARSEAESLYIMTRGSHRVGRDPEVDKAFDALREALDELKQMEIDEFDIPGEEIEESDSDGLVEAEASAGDETALAALANDDSYGLKQADELATLQSEGHEDHSTSKIHVSEAALAPSRPMLLSQQEKSEGHLAPET